MPRITSLVLMLFLIAPGVRAQSRVTGADRAGTIVEQSGGVLPGVAVTVKNLATNVTRTVSTDDRGRCLIPALPPAPYTITAELSGFTGQTRDGLVLTLGQAAEVDFTLKLAQTAETITVVGDASLVDVQNTSVSTTINQGQIDNLPINGPNFLSFSLLTHSVKCRAITVQERRGHGERSLGSGC